MKICFVILRMNVGGAEKIMVDLCRGMKAGGHQVHLASEGGPLADQLLEDGIDVHRVPGLASKHPLDQARTVPALRTLFKRVQPDVINVHAFTAMPSVALAAKLAGSSARRLFTLHIPERELYTDIMAPTLAHLAADVSFVCAHTRRELRDRGFPHDLGTVIYNGIDRAWLRPEAELAALPAPGEQASIRVGVCARLIERKGHRDLLEALARLKAEGDTRIQLEIAGEGPYRETLEQLVAARQLTDQVHFHGRRDDVGAFLDSLDLIVLPSYFEGFPVSLLEAMARGIPVLSSAVNGVPELLTEASTGYMFPARHVDALVRALKRIIASPEEVKQVRLQARALIEDKFLTEHMIAAYARWFEAPISRS